MEGRGSKIDAKTKNFIQRLLPDRKFKKYIKLTREKFGIPSKGFDIITFDELVVAEINPRIPDSVTDKEGFVGSINEFLFRQGFSHSWFEFFIDYILFGWIGEVDDKEQVYLMDLGSKNRKLSEDRIVFEACILQNPIAILIPPFVSQRDINDFISTNWSKIQAHQRKYGSKQQITQIRRKNVRVKLRNDFIYENQYLSKKVLMAQVSDKFGDILDYTYLSKIIASENKKRSEDA